ncbi:MAG: caspase family protein [Sphaerochaeta sp.]|nr:caspase family protein [Sphaerochaeta sp.]
MRKNLPKLILLLLITTLALSSCELFWEKPIEGDVYTVTIGIDYKNNDNTNDNLAGTVTDARELFFTFDSVTSKSGRNWNGYLLVQEGDARDADTFNTSILAGSDIYPSKANLEQVLYTIKSTAKSNDLTILTYSGHGFSPTGELILAHTKTSGVISTEELKLSPTTLLTWMGEIPGKKLIILDSCYSGHFLEDSSSSLSLVYENSINDWFSQYWASEDYTIPDIFLITAAADTESWETGVAGHSHGDFTLALLKGLGWPDPHPTISNNPTSVDDLSLPRARKGSVLTVDSLYTYIKEHQINPIRSTLFWPRTRVQHPMTNGGAMDMVLFRF